LGGIQKIGSYRSILKKNKGIGHCAEKCTFKARDRDVLQEFNKLIPKGNRIIFISEEGEEIVRDYR